MTYILIALGGALGAVTRYLIMLSIAFPVVTLMVNIFGSFLMGLVFIWFSTRMTGQWPLFLMTGFLGSFTTLSAFSLDVVRLFEAEKYIYVGGYVLATFVLSILAIFAGMFLMKARIALTLLK